ncbi:MAG: hypothetical protein ACR2MO_03190 [Acidimicrobiales bacterium]
MSDGHGGSDFTRPSDEAEEPVAAVADDGAGPEAILADPVGEEFDPEKLGGKVRSASGPAPQPAPTGGLGPGEAAERFGHLVRHYRMGVSGAALALAWARQENAPDGATVVVEREVSPLGRLGRMWTTAPESTLSCAIVLRPPLKVEEADAVWLLAAVAAAEGAEAASGRKLATWWPDLVVDSETGEQVAALKVEIQLGPGKVRSAVASIRIDLDKLGVGADGRDAVLEEVLAALDRHSADLNEGSAGVAAAYDGRCGMLGRRVKLRLLPKGETRGVVKGVDRSARLELESATGMVQKVGIDNLREIVAV